MNKENIIMYVADQWRSDSISLNGNRATVTPNLESLAADGINFSNAFCQNPVCVPSRNSFLSGLYPHTTGHRTMHFLADAEKPNLLKTMKENGYEVYWGGRNDFLRNDVEQALYCDVRHNPFSNMMQAMKSGEGEKFKIDKVLEKEWRQKEGYEYSHFRGIDERIVMGDLDHELIRGGIDYINTKTNDKPFFMYLAGVLPHPPYGTTPELIKNIDLTKIDKPIRLTAEELSKKPSIMRGIRENQKAYKLTDQELIELKAVYYAMGTELDRYIGELMTSLKENGLYDNTTFIFLSDHGDYTGDYEICEKNQNTFEDALTNIPLIIKPAKKHDVKTRTTDALVELVDIQATIYDLAEIEYQEVQFGRSLKSIIKGDVDEHREFVHCEGGRTELDGSYAHDAGHTKESEYWARTIEQTQMPKHTKAIMTRSQNYKYVYRLYEEDEFYDLKMDKQERNNIITSNQRKYDNIIMEHKMATLEHMVYTSDFVPNRHDKR